MVAILAGVGQCLVVVFYCISLMVGDVGRLCMHQTNNNIARQPAFLRQTFVLVTLKKGIPERYEPV